MGLYIHSPKNPVTFCAFKEITVENYHLDEAPRFVDGKLQITVPENIAVGSNMHKGKFNLMNIVMLPSVSEVPHDFTFICL